MRRRPSWVSSIPEWAESAYPYLDAPSGASLAQRLTVLSHDQLDRGATRHPLRLVWGRQENTYLDLQMVLCPHFPCGQSSLDVPRIFRWQASVGI